MRKIKAILFDKDGTLFHFEVSWGAWLRNALVRLSAATALSPRRWPTIWALT
jgi:phosphoglycolate phosphatase-like HAD superfamily hydrolase